jgi:hypothetical protein
MLIQGVSGLDGVNAEGSYLPEAAYEEQLRDRAAMFAKKLRRILEA